LTSSCEAPVRAARAPSAVLSDDAARCRLPLRSDALQEDAGGFIVRVLRHEFTPERLGEHGLVEMVDQLAGAGRLGSKTVNHSKGGVYSLHKSLGFAYVDHWYPKPFQVCEAQMRPALAIDYLVYLRFSESFSV
jgi:hypothetical protein